MSDTQVLRRCATTEEALVIQSMLIDGGFDATLDNWHYATMNWGDIAAIGGVSIRVPTSQLQDAGMYMIDMCETANSRLCEAFGDTDKSPLKRGRFRALTMLFLYFGGGIIFAIPTLFLLSFLPESWFETSEPVLSQSPYYIGNASTHMDVFPTLIVIIGLGIFAAIDIFDIASSKQKD